MDIAALIRTIPDYPRPGILFRDITTLLKDPAGFGHVVGLLVERYRAHGIDTVAGIESRGFVFAAPLAIALGAGFVPIRKRGKLPGSTVGQDYALEYGTDRVEMHLDALRSGERVLLVDDLIATGGTAEASAVLMRSVGADVVEAAFVVELPELAGRKRLDAIGLPVHSVVEFGGH
ncbi:MAG: adenine phosphoribosyltransferase [Betaproteobacteria bacterium]|nr:adenine phosphoribosyltransferase [Betaproteobacteria bacterium]